MTAPPVMPALSDAVNPPVVLPVAANDTAEAKVESDVILTA